MRLGSAYNQQNLSKIEGTIDQKPEVPTNESTK